MAVRGNGPDTDFGYELTLTLNLGNKTLTKNMTYPVAIVNICLKYYPHPIVMVRTRREHTNSKTDRETHRRTVR